MKYCINCKHHKRAPIQMGPDRAGMVDICSHPDFGHPVNGQPMPAEAVRSEERMCGIDARGFIQREQEPAPTTPTERGRILTAT